MSIRVLTKLLAGAEDLLFGKGTTSQVRNGTTYNVNRVRVVHPVDTLADIKALTTTNADSLYWEVLLLGSIAISDGLGAQYYWSATSTAAGDDDLVIVPTDNPTTGRYLKLSTSGGNMVLLDTPIVLVTSTAVIPTAAALVTHALLTGAKHAILRTHAEVTESGGPGNLDYELSIRKGGVTYVNEGHQVLAIHSSAGSSPRSMVSEVTVGLNSSYQFEWDIKLANNVASNATHIYLAGYYT